MFPSDLSQQSETRPRLETLIIVQTLDPTGTETTDHAKVGIIRSLF